MRYLSGNQIREEFLRYFEAKGHRRVHSSSLAPANDPTLLFTNAGMNQFKDVFLGVETREYTRAASSQKCVRAGGKHNDLENVGFTRRHHTFFEMLGNFSFGDYFKREAIQYAWELLTSPDWFGIDPARLYVTIFEGDAAVPRDEEAFTYWREVGVPAERIVAMGAKDNFWAMGDTGPCGPCSEIYFDLGLAASETGADKPFGEDEQRYMEIWNLVFMQFDRVIDPATGEGRLTPLPKPSIDTGMGLERIACVLQGKLSNYETDLFTPLIASAARLTGFAGGVLTAERIVLSPEQIDELAVSDETGAASLRIIADHARASTFLISDGVLPANEGRGYVLRKILRRGIRHGRLLGQDLPGQGLPGQGLPGQEKPFMHDMVLAVRDEMQAAYPELKESAERVARVVLAEELQFARVMTAGSLRVDELISKAQSVWLRAFPEARRPELEQAYQAETGNAFDSRGLAGKPFAELSPSDPAAIAALYTSFYRHHPAAHWPQAVVQGSDAFRVYETYGVPKDFIEDAVRDALVLFDEPGFLLTMQEEQARARASWQGGSQKSAAPVYRELARTEFEGYSALRVDGARILALVKGGVGVAELRAGETGEVVLDATSFYADSGGQVGDVGWMYAADHQTVVADVSGCKKPVQGVFAHSVLARQNLSVGDLVDTAVNAEVRAATMRNHTGTHLLHAALREVLGRHVKQAGSSVDRQRLRFDFSHFTGVAEEELQEVEDIVNRQVLANTPVVTLVDVPIDVAVHELGAMALFGEKYGERVRVVQIGNFSTELCGGTHTAATGEIGLLKLVGEGAVASGVRRVEAVTGTGSLGLFRRDADVARLAGQFVGSGEVSPDAFRARVAQQDEEIKRLRRELEQMRLKSASAATAGAASAAIEVKGVKVLAQRVDALDKPQMRSLVDELRGKLGSGVVVLGAATAEGKVSLIVGVTKDLTGRVQAGKLVGALAAQVGGKGGGRPDLAEAGGSDILALNRTLSGAPAVVGEMLG